MRRSRWSRATPPPSSTRPIEVALNLGVDPRHADQMVRGVVNLPKGTGKTVRVAVFAKGAKADEAKAAGADVVGAEDLMETIQGGTIDFDRVIATPDMMGVVGRLGKVLGPKGLMPNPKLGTVTMDVTKAVTDAKCGQVEFRVEKAGHRPRRHRQGELLRSRPQARISARSWTRSSRTSRRAPRASSSRRSRSARPWARASRSTLEEIAGA